MNGMADRDPTPQPAPSATPKSAATAKKPLSPAAERALAEAAERRARREGGAVSEHPPEHGGRGGLDPVRYGDWEVKGVASDF
jgi:hypothetical protein